MSAYADKIAMEVIEADALAGARGLVHPPLDWHKAVALARAVFSKPQPEVGATVECPECNVRFDPTWDRRSRSNAALDSEGEKK